MAKIQAPVLAFAGDDDPGLAPRVSGAAPDMQRLGKTFEFTGEIVKGPCAEQGASLWIWQRNMARLVGGATR